MALGTPVAAAVAYSTAGGTSVSPAYPTGILATDVVLLFIGQKPLNANPNGGTATTPSGWTLRDELLAAGGYGTTIGIDLGNTNLRVYSWNTPVAGQTGNLAITLAQNEMSWAFMVRIPKGTGSAAFGSADGQRTTTPTSPMSIALTNGATATNFQAGDLAIWAMCIPTDVTTPAQFSAQSITATGATFATAVELNEPDSSVGNDIGGYSAYASVSSGSSTTAPTVTVTLAGTLTNVRGPVVLLRVREGAATQTLTPTLYTNTQTFHNPTVAPGTVSLTPSLYTNDQTFYSPDVTTGGAAQSLIPSLYTNDQTFFAPTAAASNTLTPARYDNAQTFYAPSVAASNTLAASLYTNDQTFFAAVVSQTGGLQTLLPSLYANDQTFYSPTLAASYALAPALLTNAQSFYGPTAAASYALSPALYTNGQTFPAATVTTVKTLTPSLYTNDQTFPAATVGSANALEPSLYVNPQAFYSPTVSSPFAPGTELFPSLYVNDQAFYAPAVLPGPVELLPQGYSDPGYVDVGYTGPNTYSEQIFYPATVIWDQFVAPQLLVNTQIFFPGAVDLLYPSPSDVRAGVRYGPGGIYVGTLTVGGGETIIRLRSFSERC